MGLRTLRRRLRSRFLAGLAVAVLGLNAPAAALAAEWTVSHQFPAGDPRDEMLQRIAAEASLAGIETRIFGDASLMAARDQWAALVEGRLDMTLIPLEYMLEAMPALGVLHLPGMVRSHEQAARLSRSPVMAELKQRLESLGVVVLADAWVPGALGGVDGCILRPEDVRGLRMRSAGLSLAEMWRGAGAVPVSSFTSDALPALLGSRLVDAVETTTASMVAFNLERRLACVTVPGENSLWFVYEPVMVSRQSWQGLTARQRQALRDAGRRAQEWFAKTAPQWDRRMAETFRAAGTRVESLTPEQFDAWLALAHETSYRSFAERVPEGRQLIGRAKGKP